ncbi:MAG: class E sortase [Actinomycetota bacterium]|nr:class E sortase [Actinomycetota bacterium]
MSRRFALTVSAVTLIVMVMSVAFFDDNDNAVTATSTTTTVAATTTTSTTTTTTSTTSTTSTTTTTTTTTLPTPAPPPSDTKAAEPVIELGTISIPAIDVEMGLHEGFRLTTLDLGPGHWPGTAMPGAQGNVVVAGHRVSKHQVFLRINELVVGDEIIYETDAGRFVYAVTDLQVVEPSDLWIIDQTPAYTTTLFACHPPGSTAQRYAVSATLVR